MTIETVALANGWASRGHDGALMWSSDVSPSDVWDEAIKACAAICEARRSDPGEKREARYMAESIAGAIRSLRSDSRPVYQGGHHSVFCDGSVHYYARGGTVAGGPRGADRRYRGRCDCANYQKQEVTIDKP